MVEVFAFRILDDEDFLSKKEGLLHLLPPENRNFIARFKRTSGAQRSLFGELLARFIIGKTLGVDSKTIAFNKSKNGKPFLNKTGLHFNLSHSGDYVVMALSDHEVGIDVEVIRPINYRIAERFFSPQEVSVLNLKAGYNKLEYFFDLWTLKESYLKLIGTGLTRSLSSFTIEIKDGEFMMREKMKRKNANVYFEQYPLEAGYKLSVCSYNKNFTHRVKWITIKDFLKK
jgi:4'-phosphopantetheinyl transferase